MGTKSFRAVSYLQYLASAKSIQYIHSPFLFDLMRFVFDDASKKFPREFLLLEEQRKKMLHNSTTVNYTDFGAGGDVAREKTMVVKDIASLAVKQRKYSRFLYRLIQYQKSTEVIELGTSLGITTSYLSLACNKVHTVEADENILSIAKNNWQQLSRNNIHSYCFDLNSSLSQLYGQLNTIDFLFIDANHRKEAMIRYVLQALPYIHQHSIIVLDDIYWSEETLQAWEILKKRKEVSLSFDIFQMGVLFFDCNLSKQHFTLRY